MNEYLDVPYVEGGTDKQCLDIFLPDAASALAESQSCPLIVYVHGGVWRTGDRIDHRALARRICRQSVAVHAPVAVAVISYRLSLVGVPETQYPVQQHDCEHAVAFLARNSAAWPYDPHRIYLVGQSAGGQLVSMMYLRHMSAHADVGHAISFGAEGVRGIVGVQGLYDLPRLVEQWPDYREFVEQTFGPDRAMWQAGSPAHLGQVLVDKSRMHAPHFLLIHSLEDELVDRGQTDTFLAHLHQLNIPAHGDFSLKGQHESILATDAFSLRIIAFVQETERYFAPLT